MSQDQSCSFSPLLQLFVRAHEVWVDSLTGLISGRHAAWVAYALGRGVRVLLADIRYVRQDVLGESDVSPDQRTSTR